MTYKAIFINGFLERVEFINAATRESAMYIARSMSATHGILKALVEFSE